MGDGGGGRGGGAQLKELNDRLLRSFAEMENVRTRMTKQADDAKKFALQVS